MEIKANNITKKYKGKNIICNLNMNFQEGKVHCLFGPSGCGKTTLLRMILKLEQPDSGEIEGLENKNISAVFQEERLITWLNVKENLEIVIDKNSYEDNQRVKDILDIIGLKDNEYSYTKELSGGMKQRVSIGRALVYDGDILLIDEPFKGLNLRHKERIMNYMIKNWKKKERIIIFVTHNIEEAIRFSDHIYIMKGTPLDIIEKLTILDKYQDRNEDIQKKYRDKIIIYE